MDWAVAMLIGGEDDTAILAAEDAAILAAQTAPVTVDGITVQAPVGTPLADFILLLGDTNGTRTTDNHE